MKRWIGRWEMQVEAPSFIASELVKEMERFLNQEWRPVMLEGIGHPWWSVNHLQIPSPLVRMDMAPVVEPGAIKGSIYEVEARPAGLGLMLSLAPERVEQWKGILLSCQCKCKGFLKIQSSIQDDKLAAELLGIPYYEEIPNKLEGPYWIRSNARAGEITALESISLVPIRLDGDKTYLVKLGMAEMLTQEEQLDWSSAFAVKPLVGSRMEGVEIYLPNSLQKVLRARGSTQSQVRRAISKATSQRVPYLIQKFIPPQREEMNGQTGWTIWRLFFGWEGKYVFLGGLWNWRTSLRVHGASDAIFGTIEMGT